jgi:hypothetical protein
VGCRVRILFQLNQITERKRTEEWNGCDNEA